jgi:hypothetical protein
LAPSRSRGFRAPGRARADASELSSEPPRAACHSSPRERAGPALSDSTGPALSDSNRRGGADTLCRPGAAGGKARGATARHRRAGKHADAGHDLGVRGGLAALSLDALSSVAYGPEAMMLVLVAAGSGALRFTVPLTLVITGMLALLVISYTQATAS